MKVHCRTNLDDYQREEWPTDVAVRPIKGDYIKSQSGKSLVVSRITHCQPRGRSMSMVDHYPGEPYLEVELARAAAYHLTTGGIS